MAEPLRHRQTKEADNRYVPPKATAPHLDYPDRRFGDVRFGAAPMGRGHIERHAPPVRVVPEVRSQGSDVPKRVVVSREV